MKTTLSRLLYISLFSAIAALCLLFVTATPTSAHAGYAQQTNFHQLIPEQALPGGGGGHGSGGHGSSGHSSSSHSTSSHDTTTDSVSSDSSSNSSSSHYYNTQYNSSSGSSSLDWPTCLTLLVIGAIVLLVVMVWKRRNS